MDILERTTLNAKILALKAKLQAKETKEDIASYFEELQRDMNHQTDFEEEKSSLRAVLDDMIEKWKVQGYDALDSIEQKIEDMKMKLADSQ